MAEWWIEFEEKEQMHNLLTQNDLHNISSCAIFNKLKRYFMRTFFTLAFCFGCSIAFSQTVAKVPDSIRRKVDEYNGVTQGNAPGVPDDAAIKKKLIAFALKNGELVAAEANVESAVIARKKASTSFLSSVSIGGNVNEFVISNSSAANLFPKYNAGVSIPLDLFTRTSAEKRIASQTIVINKAQRDLVEANLKSRVLIQYEIYKERKTQVELQKIAMEDDVAAYQRAQKEFEEDNITLEELNKSYKASITEQSILASKEKDFQIAILQLEEIIGVPLASILQK